ncbi:hypothetical protein BRARA_F00018 [Brassica rapa]|uniref:25S rRNA (uridine-N(3))-methyltransferase BMT5-like domain-containing protein n=1 Tax=Brassica campestris TaxID=3711 RepID=A0A397Z2Q5_BRACM|nr:hypothetical protein BRARA_F00018 [Brassica rapa]
MATSRELSSKLIRDYDDDEEVWLTHYSSNHQILLVGEGDFSFSCSLASRFRSASNICASSLDSYDDVVRKYSKARSNLATLKRLGASLLHGVDATKLHLHPHLNSRRFDRIIFNFPHAGFHGKETDSRLIQADGEIHVSHKDKAPFCHWNLEELASRCSLVLTQCVAFEKSEYPGYENKRGDGSRCDKPFPLGECTTFKFAVSRVAKEIYAEKVRWRETKERESKLLIRFSGVPLDIYNRERQSMLTRTSYPRRYTGESPERRPLLWQEPFFLRSSHQLYGWEGGRTMSTSTGFHHLHTEEGRLIRQRNLSIYHPYHCRR